ncbi:MAG: glycoside hydrolase family 3 N-terminal domain-containing protein [Pseudomonadota bacterium]
MGGGTGGSVTGSGGSVGTTGGMTSTSQGGQSQTSTGGSGGTGPGGGEAGTGNTGNPTTGGSDPGPGPGGAGNEAGTGNMPAGGSGGEVTPMSCGDAPTQQFDPKTMPGYTAPRDQAVDQLLANMNTAQKIAQMQGIDGTAKNYDDIERSPDVDVGGMTIRGYRYRDAGHGVNLDAGQDNRAKDANNFSTAFPQQSSRGASWDLDLEWRLGEAMGDETAASLNNMLLAPCMNIIRHPYWGRTQETYGEDMYHMGRMASAYTAGVQQFVAACAKHFAANNVEKNRANQDAVMTEQTLREIYGRHFEMVIQDGGVACIMAAYNKINGVKSTQNQHLLTTILRGPLEQGGMGFRGLVISDWWAMPGDQGPIEPGTAKAQAVEAAIAGLDIEVPWTLNYGQLPAAVQDGSLDVDVINQSAGRILEQKFRFKTAYATDGWGLKPPESKLEGASIATNQKHLDLAEEAEIKSAVLLKNGTPDAPVLPIKGTPSIAVVGLDVPFTLVSTTYPKSGNTFHFATDVAVGDRGSSRVNADPAHSVGPFAGIQQIGALHGVTNVTSGNSVEAAAGADFVVVMVGLTPGDEGEEYAIPAGGDRSSLDLPANQNQFVSQVLDLNKPTAIIIQSGSIVNLPWLTHANQNQATIWAGYGGMRAGLAYAKLLFAHEGANFSGKMPLAWPKQEDLIPFKTQELRTEMGYFFGYREYDRRAAAGTPVELVFPFGHGLSYSTFEYSNLQIPCTDVTKKGIVNVTVDVTNTSAVDGEEIVMLFVKPPPKPEGITGERPVKELKSFAKVKVPAGQTVKATLPLRVQDLRRWEGDKDGNWVIDNGDYTILVGKSGADADLTLSGTLTIHD